MAQGFFSSAVITGATGPIGMKLIQHLTRRNIRVLAICNPHSDRNRLLVDLPLVRTVNCGLEGLEETRPYERYDAFFHLGWIGGENRSTRNNIENQERNVAYTLNAVRFAHAAGCMVFVGAGSQAEYGHVRDGILRQNTPTYPEEAYGIAKNKARIASAALCARLGIRHCWSRILSIYGEYDRPTTLIMYAAACLLRGQEPEFTPCEQKWDYIYSGDCAKALYEIAVSGRDGAAYPLGSGTAKPLREYLEELRQRINPKIAMRYGALPYPEGQVMHIQADMSSLLQDTGFVPKTSFAEGVDNLIEFLEPVRIVSLKQVPDYLMRYPGCLGRPSRK